MEKKINTKAKKEIVLIFLNIFFISLVSAVPPIPDHFIGNVLINEQNASIGTQINVYVDDILEGTVITTIVGKYDLYVKNGDTDDTIEFKISDILAGNSTRQGGETIPLNLSITTTTTPPSSGSSGSSGGGGGGGGGSPSYYASPQDTTPKNNFNFTELNLEENKTQSQETEEQEEISPGITSAVVGFLGSGKGNIVIAFVIILGIGVMLIKFKPQKWTKRFS